MDTFPICGYHLKPGQFSSHILSVLSSGGDLFILDKPLYYFSQAGELFQIPHGAQSDGISAPKCAAALGRTAGGNDWAAGWFHDAAYRNTLQIWVPTLVGRESSRASSTNQPEPSTQNPQPSTGQWQLAKLSKAQSDAYLRECALACGDSSIEAETLYLAVAAFGRSSFNADR